MIVVALILGGLLGVFVLGHARLLGFTLLVCFTVGVIVLHPVVALVILVATVAGVIGVHEAHRR